MPLQNRVDPRGNLQAVPHRGKWMGNRGLLHNGKKEIVRHSQLDRWIYCKLEFKGWHREVMRPGHYTELFFLDEATALAAGHRPCMECQRERATEFKRIWNEVNEPVKTLVEMDEILRGKNRVSSQGSFTIAEAKHLHDGTMVTDDGTDVFLVLKGKTYKWSFAGYEEVQLDKKYLTILTPEPIRRVLEGGFKIDLPNP